MRLACAWLKPNISHLNIQNDYRSRGYRCHRPGWFGHTASQNGKQHWIELRQRPAATGLPAWARQLCLCRKTSWAAW